MSDAMSSTTTKPKPVRRAVGAVLIPVERFEAWYGSHPQCQDWTTSSAAC
jgi:hypothetical protein